MPTDPRRLIPIALDFESRSRDARASQHRRNELIGALNEARRDLAVAEEKNGRRLENRRGDRNEKTPADADLAAAILRTSELSSAVEHASADADAAFAEYSAAGQLFESCIEFLKERGIPLPIEASLERRS